MYFIKTNHILLISLYSASTLKLNLNELSVDGNAIDEAVRFVSETPDATAAAAAAGTAAAAAGATGIAAASLLPFKSNWFIRSATENSKANGLPIDCRADFLKK